MAGSGAAPVACRQAGAGGWSLSYSLRTLRVEGRGAGGEKHWEASYVRITSSSQVLLPRQRLTPGPRSLRPTQALWRLPSQITLIALQIASRIRCSFQLNRSLSISILFGDLSSVHIPTTEQDIGLGKGWQSLIQRPKADLQTWETREGSRRSTSEAASCGNSRLGRASCPSHAQPIRVAGPQRGEWGYCWALPRQMPANLLPNTGQPQWSYSDPQGLWVEGDPRAKQPPWGPQPQRALRPAATYTEWLQALGSIRTQNSPHSPVHLGANLKRFRNFSRKTRCLYLTLKQHHPIIYSGICTKATHACVPSLLA